MEILTRLAVVALFVAVIWLVMQRRYALVIRIVGGMPRVTKGRVTAAFLQQLGQACTEFNVARGWIAGLPRGRRMELSFSRSIPPPCRQRLRNLWILQG